VIGYLLSLSALSGTLASILAGYTVDRTKKFKEFIKFSYVGVACIAVALNIVRLYIAKIFFLDIANLIF
jgi:hypothetical protein